MLELLIEILSENIPTKMQTDAEKHFSSIFQTELDKNHIPFDKIITQSTARRLVLCVQGIPLTLPSFSQEKTGPQINCPENVLTSFLKKYDATIAALSTRRTAKGEYYVLSTTHPERSSKDLLPEIINKSIRSLPWSKSMRWGSTSFKWPRPMKRILAVFDGHVFDGSFDLGSNHSIQYTNTSTGHRFLNPSSFVVTSYADYVAQLVERDVLFDRKNRREIIEQQAAKLTHQNGLCYSPDKTLLEEIVGLVEFPVVMLGKFEGSFLEIPPEAIIQSLKSNQRYFTTNYPDGSLSPYFLFVANQHTRDAGRTIISGNEKVIRARLSDALFFWQADKKLCLADRRNDLASIKFHDKLGTMLDKTKRVASLSKSLAQQLGTDSAAAETAAMLAKADLTTNLVREFPELQGIIGYRSALNEGYDVSVATAIKSHYSPLGPTDDCPQGSLPALLALADKIDTLTGFFSVGEVPTSSKDPFALRRAAMGVIRICLANRLDLDLFKIVSESAEIYDAPYPTNINAFLLDRLQSTLSGQGIRSDVWASVLAHDTCRVTDLTHTATKLQEYLATPQGQHLYTTVSRINNILPSNADNKTQPVNTSLFESNHEQLLFLMIDTVKKNIPVTGFEKKLQLLSSLINPIEGLLKNVMIHTQDSVLQKNRIALLSSARDVFNNVANFMKIKPLPFTPPDVLPVFGAI